LEMKTRILRHACLASALFALIGSAVDGQAAAPQAIVIQGGTLIDGNGGAPVANSVVVIEQNRITAVGTAGNVNIPNGAQVIDASGKYVLPGLLDAKANWYWPYGEAALRWGVTSVFVSGGRNDTGIAIRDAVNHGIIESPRQFQTYVTLDGAGPDGEREDDYMPGDGGKIIATPEEGVEWVQHIAAVGADFVTFGNGDGPTNIWQAAIDEAERHNLPIVFRAMGPQTRAREVCAMADGVVMIHTGNAGAQTAANEDNWAEYIGLPPDAYSEMDDAKAGALIEELVGCNAYLEPDLMAADRGFHRNWARVQAEDEAFTHDLPPYYSMKITAGVLENVKSPETYLSAEQLAVRRSGFANHMRFLKRYVDAGGKIVPASDNPQTHPGLGLQQEVTAFVEDIGLTPMQAILSATSWTADAFQQADLGRIEAGKLADVIIVDDDPLANILNLRSVDTVIKDGEIVDLAWDPEHKGLLFANRPEETGTPLIEGLDWAMALKRATWRPNSRNGGWGGTGGIDSEMSPTPGIEGIMPYVVNQNSGDTELTVTGFNFVEGSRVSINGHVMPTTVASRTELKVMVPASIIAEAGKHQITVTNPQPLQAPTWGDTSNPAFLLVPFEFTTAHSQNRW
jgi:imidazolonepropionase-like amidohydrolase